MRTVIRRLIKLEQGSGTIQNMVLLANFLFLTVLAYILSW